MKQEESDKLREEHSEEVDREIYASDESLQLADQRRQRRYLSIGASVVVLILVVIVVAVWKWRKSSAPAEAEVTPVVSVKVAKVEKQTIAAPVSAVGTVFP